MNKIRGLVLIVMLLIVVGCKQNSQLDEPTGDLMADIAINIEGTIVNLTDNGFVLDNGQTVIITEETRFEDDPDCGIEPVNSEFQVGNIIQGYTEEDSSMEVVKAYVINANIFQFKGVIKEINENTAIVTPDEGEMILSSGNAVKISLPNAHEFKIGEKVIVHYDGKIMESDPLQINTELVISEEKQ